MKLKQTKKQLVYDNIDRIEETLSGKDTTHRVNRIAVQRGFNGPLSAKQRTPVPKNKRSIQTEDQGISPYNVGANPVPQYPFKPGEIVFEFQLACSFLHPKF